MVIKKQKTQKATLTLPLTWLKKSRWKTCFTLTGSMTLTSQSKLNMPEGGVPQSLFVRIPCVSPSRSGPGKTLPQVSSPSPTWKLPAFSLKSQAPAPPSPLSKMAYKPQLPNALGSHILLIPRTCNCNKFWTFSPATLSRVHLIRPARRTQKVGGNYFPPTLAHNIYLKKRFVKWVEKRTIRT